MSRFSIFVLFSYFYSLVKNVNYWILYMCTYKCVCLYICIYRSIIAAAIHRYIISVILRAFEWRNVEAYSHYIPYRLSQPAHLSCPNTWQRYVNNYFPLVTSTLSRLWDSTLYNYYWFFSSYDLCHFWCKNYFCIFEALQFSFGFLIRIVLCYMFYTLCVMLYALCFMPYTLCCMPHITCLMLLVWCFMFPTLPLMSYTLYFMPYILFLIFCVLWFISYVLYLMFYDMFLTLMP